MLAPKRQLNVDLARRDNEGFVVVFLVLARHFPRLHFGPRDQKRIGYVDDSEAYSEVASRDVVCFLRLPNDKYKINSLPSWRDKRGSAVSFWGVAARRVGIQVNLKSIRIFPRGEAVHFPWQLRRQKRSPGTRIPPATQAWKSTHTQKLIQQYSVPVYSHSWHSLHFKLNTNNRKIILTSLIGNDVN